jgi:diaminopimelate epimerase
MTTAFAKMHGLGNDFMVMEAAADGSVPSAAILRAWADRHTGVGFDQLLLIGSSNVADASYRVFNADGQEVEQCANGARCVARFVAERDHHHELTLASLGGIISARVDNGEVTLGMGEPNFDPASLPFTAQRAERYQLRVANQEVSFGAVSMGNPHAVVIVDSVETAPVGILGPGLEHHVCFPRGVNAGFAEIVNRQRVKLRVHERGVGETRACGTGAAAAVAVGRSWGLLDAAVVVELPGGELRISWPGPGKPLGLTGPASWVYRGNLER